MKSVGLLLLNTVTLLFTLVINYIFGSGTAGKASVGEISARYENLFTPAGYAFAIWGVIYLMLLAFVGYQWYAWVKHKDDEYLRKTGIWFALGNLANGFWIIAWTNDQIGLSFALILILLISLFILMFRLRLEIWDAPVRIIAFVWWPICVYLGWIVAATLANLASWSVKLNPVDAFALQSHWVVIMIIAAFTIYFLLMYLRNMREAAFVGIWAFVAIVIKNYPENYTVVHSALAASVILLVYAAWHGFKNREASPFKKMKRGEI
jgi:hypothetical protein